MEIAAVMEALKKNNYEVAYFATKEQAAAYLNRAIDGKTVGMGDSATLLALGVYEQLCQHNQVHSVAHEPDDISRFLTVAARCLGAQIFLTSVNAIAASGELVNIDGTGNRVAGSLFGHEKVYFVAGQNKISPTLEEAIWRARNIAAPQNAKRFGKKTPCAIRGDKCYNCNSAERICNGMVIHYKKMSNMNMEVVLIGEDLGM